MKINEAKTILKFLEAAVDTETDLTTVEKLAKNHLSNEKKITELQQQIEALMNKQTALEDSNSNIEDDILEIIGNVKSQSLRFGKILVDFKVTRETGVTRSSPQWKNITLQLQKQFNIEQKIIDSLTTKFNNGGKEFTTVNKTLSITKESRQLIKESFINILRSIWIGFKQVFSTLGRSFKNQNDYLEELLNKI